MSSSNSWSVLVWSPLQGETGDAVVGSVRFGDAMRNTMSCTLVDTCIVLYNTYLYSEVCCGSDGGRLALQDLRICALECAFQKASMAGNTSSILQVVPLSDSSRRLENSAALSKSDRPSAEPRSARKGEGVRSGMLLPQAERLRRLEPRTLSF